MHGRLSRVIVILIFKILRVYLKLVQNDFSLETKVIPIENRKIVLRIYQENFGIACILERTDL
jgi:hypothetical protein